MPQPNEERPKVAECKSCQAQICWAKVTKKDGTPGNMPFDRDPTDQGTHRMSLSFTQDEDGRTNLIVKAEWVDKKERPALLQQGIRLRTSHFATCPNADSHRRQE